MRRLNLSLAHKVAIALVIVIVSVIALFLKTNSFNKAHLERLILNGVRTMAEGRESEVYLFLEMNRSRIVDFASDGVIRGELEKIVAGNIHSSPLLSDYIIKNKLSVYKQIRALSVISAGGRIVASSDKTMLGADVSGEDYFKRGGAGIQTTERNVGAFGPEMVFTVPMTSLKSGRPVGMLAGFVPVAVLERIFYGEEIIGYGALTSDIIGRWKTLEVYVVNKDSLMLTRSRFIKDAVLRQKVASLPVEKCIRDGAEMTGFYRDYRGVDVAGSSMCIRSLGWTLLVEVDKDEILAPASQVHRLGVATISLTLGLIGVLAVFFMRVVISQLRALSQAAKTVASGNYDVGIPVESGDEIGLLAESFNSMVNEINGRRKELAESEERLRTILDGTTNVVFIKDTGNRYTFVNGAFEAVTGRGRADILGKTDFDLFPRETAVFLRENDSIAIRSDKPVEFEEKVSYRGGQRDYISVKFPLKDLNGRAYAVCGVSTDVTRLKEIEDALRKNEAGLANAQRLARIGSWEWEIEDNRLHLTDEMYRISGDSPGGVQPLSGNFMRRVHPDDRGRLTDAIADALYWGRMATAEFRITLDDGSVKTVRLQCEPAYDGSGRPVRMTGTLQDVTEQKEAEDEIRRLNAELEERVARRTADLEAANRELESFSYSVAHDLRAPLRIIDGFSHALEEDYSEKLGSEGAGHVKRVRGAAKRMGDIIDDLLKLSRVMRAEMRSESVDLSGVARSVAEECRKAEPERRVDFVVEDGLAASGDAVLLRLVLENLIGNAWKFTGRKERARIEFGAAGKEGLKTVYFVADNGAGFDLQYSDKLFQAFERLHSSSEFGGTGVGLATVKRIIERHGGRVWAVGYVNRGATFYFTL